jgi:two-component system, OmpR family, phosphate regulon response regulator PhoB
MTRGGQPTVLLVEDEAAQRTVLAYNLEAEGFAVTQADNGEDAMVLVDEEAPDIIILDWMMPRVSRSSCFRRGPRKWTASGDWRQGRTTM